jgi:hypothetical protein
MAPPVGSVTLPLTCAIATAWALEGLGSASQQRIEIDSSNRLLKVDRDSLVMKFSPESNLGYRRNLDRLAIALTHLGIF